MDDAYWYRHTAPDRAFAVMKKDANPEAAALGAGVRRMYSRFATNAMARAWVREWTAKGWEPEFLFTIDDVNAYHDFLNHQRAA